MNQFCYVYPSYYNTVNQSKLQYEIKFLRTKRCPGKFLLFRKLQDFIYVIFPYYFTTHLGALHVYGEERSAEVLL